MNFPSTQWSVLARATMHGEPGAQAALDQICRAYWRPLHAFARMRGFGEEDAADLIQSFLLRLCQQSFWRRAEPGKGRFRSYLLGALAHFLADERDRRAAQKRGGLVEHVSLAAEGSGGELVAAEDASSFDREWACAVMEQAMEQITGEWREREGAFRILRHFLPGASRAPSLEQAAAELGWTLSALKSQVHRLRERFREIVRERVAVTVSAPHEIQEELQHLSRILRDPGAPW